MLRFLDAGESHGRGMVSVLEGVPHGLGLTAEHIERELSRRRLGYGRGARMRLEADEVVILSGVRFGRTLGSPIAMLVENAEFERWREIMGVDGEEKGERMTRLRPGHADLAGALKYGTGDVRDILERASARETVGRVCVGAVAKRLLGLVGITVGSHVVAVGGVEARQAGAVDIIERSETVDRDPMRCLDREASERMILEVDRAREGGDSLGGVFEVVAVGVPPGLGSHVHWDRRLDTSLAASVMSIQAVKGVEIGAGFAAAAMRGSDMVDPIRFGEGEGFYRLGNNAGGVEGGISNGMELVVRGAMKPIPTMGVPVESVDLVTGESVEAATERADVCAVPAAAVIAESAVAFVLADAMLEKLGGDSVDEVKARYDSMIESQRRG